MLFNKLKLENYNLGLKIIELEENIDFLIEKTNILKKRIRNLERKNTELTKQVKEKECNIKKVC